MREKYVRLGAGRRSNLEMPALASGIALRKHRKKDEKVPQRKWLVDSLFTCPGRGKRHQPKKAGDQMPGEKKKGHNRLEISGKDLVRKDYVVWLRNGRSEAYTYKTTSWGR